MSKKVETVTQANALYLRGLRESGEKLTGQKATGRDEAVIRAASERDRAKYIPIRMN